MSLTIFVAFLIPIYWHYYGPTNFLWFSDIGLFLTVIALWIKSPLLISMMCVGVLPIELIWNIDYFVHLLTGRTIFGMAAYMFDASLPLFLRAFSLFHIVVLLIWIYFLREWGYDRRALIYWLLLFWATMLCTYFLTDPQSDINWVFIPETHGWKWLPSYMWLLFLMVAFPVFIFLPMHYFLSKMAK